MKTRRQQELDLKALEDEFSSVTTSSSEEESSTSESREESMEIMGITSGDSNRNGLQDNPSTPHNKPLVEESKLQQMWSTDLSFDERKEYLCMLRRFPMLFIDC